MAQRTTQRIGNKAKGRQHSNHKAKYERQKVRTWKNKIRKLKKHLLRHPKDQLAKVSLEKQ